MKRVIIADDELYFHTNLTQGLKSRIPELVVETVWNGDELVEKVLKGDYVAIITDYNMGPVRLNGLDASKAIRDAGVTTPIFLYSTNNFRLEDVSSSGITQVFDKSDNKSLFDSVVELFDN